MEIVAERKNNMIPFALINLWSSDMFFFSLIFFFSLMNRKAQKEFEELLEEAHQQ